MLQILISLLIYFVVFSGFGSLLDEKFNQLNQLSFQLINGMFVIAIVSLVTSMFMPLSIYYEVIVVIIGVGLFTYNKCWESFFKLKKSILLLFLLTCFVGSINAFLFDTFSYYLPTIKWLDNFGLVKGLANYDFNLGQTSLWHIIQASFNDSFDVFYKINVFIIAVYLIYIYEINQQKLILFLPLFYLFVASPSPDLPVFILSILIFLNWYQSQSIDSIKYGLIIGAFIVLIKPIAFVFPVFFFILSLKNIAYYKSIYLLVFGLMMLFFIKNIILSGNFLFPLSIGNLSFLKHAVPASIYDISALEGRFMAVSRTKYISKESVQAMSLLSYYKYLSQNLHLSLYIFISIVVIQFLSFFVFIYKKNLEVSLLMFLFIVKAIVFMIISPQYRFLLDGFLIVALFVLAMININKLIIYVVVYVSSISFVFTKNIVDNFTELYFMEMLTKYRAKQLLIPTNYNLKTEKVKLFNLKSNYILNYPFSYNVDPIALNSTLLGRYWMQNFHPELIDSNDINKGFIMRQNSISDKESIENILFLNNSDQKSNNTNNTK